MYDYVCIHVRVDTISNDAMIAGNQESQPQQLLRRAARYARFQVHGVSVSGAH